MPELSRPTATFRPFDAVLQSHPKLARHLLVNWCRKCKHIGHPVRVSPPGSRPPKCDVCVEDVAAAVRRFRDDLPDEFTDADGVSWSRVENLGELHKLSRVRWWWWQTKGCPPLGGRPLDVVTYHQWGTTRQQGYIRTADADAIFGGELPPADPAAWCDLAAAAELGFDPDFLSRHSETGSPSKRRTGVPHPAIDRLIRTDRRLVRSKSEPSPGDHPGRRPRHHWAVCWLRQDLLDILNADPPSTKRWKLGPRALREYGLTESQLGAAVKYGRVRAERFAVPVAGLRPELRQFYEAAGLDAEATRIAGVRSLPRPGSADRVYVDGEGVRWWPDFETRKRLGVSAQQLARWRVACEHLDGQPFAAIRPDRPLWRNKHGPAWHYREDQREQIYRRMDNLPDGPSPRPDPPDPAAPTRPPRRRGRPAGSTKLTASQQDRYRRLAAAWGKFSSHGTKADFVGQVLSRREPEFPGLTVDELTAALVWVRKYPRGRPGRAETKLPRKPPN